MVKNCPTKHALDRWDSAHISSSPLCLIVFPVGRLRRPRPSVGNAIRWHAPCKAKVAIKNRSWNE